MRTQKPGKKKGMMLLGILLFILLITGTGLWISRPMLKFAENPECFRTWVENHAWSGRILFCLLLIVQVFAAVIPGEPLEIAAGYIFGAMEGTVLCVIGETLGGILVFLFVRRFGVCAVETFFSTEKIKNLRFLQHTKRRDLLFLLLFLLPGTPKDLLCYFAGLTGISFRNWCVIQIFGRLVSILTSTLGGYAIGTRQYVGAVLVLGITGILSLIGIAIYRWICRKANARNDKQ